MAQTVRGSNGAPPAARMPNAANVASVATASATASYTAQRRPNHSPTPAATYANPARKLNQTTNGT
jgi:hypothetical protein